MVTVEFAGREECSVPQPTAALAGARAGAGPLLHVGLWLRLRLVLLGQGFA